MDESTFWWVLAGVAVAAELMTGTFYLLMLALGPVGAALAASAGAPLTTQIAVAAALGVGAVLVWRWLQMQRSRPSAPAQSNPDVNMDVGQTIQIAAWTADGSAQVHYRGAQWTAVHRAGVQPSTGEHRVVEVIGARLLVEKT
jgi:membrane protein implicated in regulation of membrane protease activity